MDTKNSLTVFTLSILTDWLAWANNDVTDQGLLVCLSPSSFSDTSTGSEMDLFKLKDNYGEELWGPNS